MSGEEALIARLVNHFQTTLRPSLRSQNWRRARQPVQCTTACQFYLFVVDRESSRWQRPARISVGRFLKANWSGTVLFVHITLLDLRLTMAVCWMVQPCIHSRAWKSACETARSKCANHQRKADSWVFLVNPFKRCEAR